MIKSDADEVNGKGGEGKGIFVVLRNFPFKMFVEEKERRRVKGKYQSFY